VSPNKIRTLISESSGFAPQAAELLGRVGELVLADLDRRELLAAVGEADVLWVRLRNRIDAEVMTAAHRLKVIVTPTTGLNHIDLEEAGRRGIRVLSLRGESDFLRDVRAPAEHTMALILALLRRVPGAMAHVRDGGWNRDLFKGRELHGKTVGIVGYGRLGRIMARYLTAFDTHVLAADPHIDMGALDPGVRPVTLAQLLQDADLVTLHVNLCDETERFFGQEQFALMKEGAWFINTSRGEVVDESALLKSLHSGHLAGAALDVLCHEDSEGMKDHPLVVCARDHDHLMITPHIGGCTVESMEKTELFLAKELASVVSDGLRTVGLCER
jgi:D-3-phosphoglycerate dehydrogenase / 2-oxoglutarate reductase